MLTRSFDGNGSVNYIVRQDDKREQRIRALMEYSVAMCEIFGEVWLSDDRKACALVLYPDRQRASFRTFLLDLRLMFRAIGVGGVKKVKARKAKVAAIRPKEKMAYLWFIGVDPQHQHAGHGSRMLQEVLRHSADLPVYLETSMPKNLPWYQRFGFEIYDELDLGYTLYFLRRQ